MPRLWGWSWRGWIALVVLGVMLAAMARGVDLRFQMQKLIMPLGWGAQSWFVAGFLPSLRFGSEMGAVGPVTLCWMLIVLHLSPIRGRGWAYAAVTILSVALPWCWWKASGVMMSMPASGGRVLPIAPWVNGPFALNAVLSYVPVLGVLFAATRSWRLVLLMMGAAVVLIMPTGHVRFTRLSSGQSLAYTIGVNLVMCSMLAWWGVKARRRMWPEYMCQGCGYDLRGILADVCPECGKSINAQAGTCPSNRPGEAPTSG